MERKLYEFEKFFEFCDIACPSYLSNFSSKHVKRIASNILSYGEDFTELLKSAENFKKNYPFGKLEKDYVMRELGDLKGKSLKAFERDIVSQHTGINLPDSPEISSKFYYCIIKDLLEKKH